MSMQAAAATIPVCCMLSFLSLLLYQELKFNDIRNVHVLYTFISLSGILNVYKPP